MRCDYHVHTDYSLDCQTPMLNQLKKAAELGLEEICLTDHSEHNYKDEPALFTLDIPAYKKGFSELPDLGVRVRWGCELCIVSDEAEAKQHADIIHGGGFDFVIASVHMVDFVDPYYPYFYANRTVSQANAVYIEALARYLKRIPPEYFSAGGHVDYGAKFNPDKSAIMRYSDCPDTLDELFKYVIENGKCIEVNTSTYRRLGRDIPGLDWLTRYRELGGEYITFGGDAHITEHIAYRFDEAAELAKAAGIKYYATYKGMTPIMHRI